VPTPPRNLHVNLFQVDPPTVKVTWQRPKETYGVLEQYKIIWGPRGERYVENLFASEVYSYLTPTLGLFAPASCVSPMYSYADCLSPSTLLCKGRG
jgi:hypothetical protein